MEKIEKWFYSLVKKHFKIKEPVNYLGGQRSVYDGGELGSTDVDKKE
jgi:hypothetical protein